LRDSDIFENRMTQSVAIFQKGFRCYDKKAKR